MQSLARLVMGIVLVSSLGASLVAHAEEKPPCLYGTDANAWVSSIWQAILHRQPSYTEYVNSMNALDSNPLGTLNPSPSASQNTLNYNLVYSLVDSPEARAQSSNNNIVVYGASFSLYGAAYSDPGHMNNVLFLIGLYKSILNRAPDAGGLEFWTTQLSQGMTREQVAATFYATPEYMSLDVLTCQ